MSSLSCCERLLSTFTDFFASEPFCLKKCKSIDLRILCDLIGYTLLTAEEDFSLVGVIVRLGVVVFDGLRSLSWEPLRLFFSRSAIVYEFRFQLLDVFFELIV